MRFRTLVRRASGLIVLIVLSGPEIALGLDPTRALTQYIFEQKQIDDGLPPNSVMAIQQTRDGYLWLGTRRGLFRYNGQKFALFEDKKPPGLKSSYIVCLFESRDGSLWIGTHGGGLTRLREGEFTTYTTKEGLLSDHVFAIAEDRDGALWIGTYEGGLERFKDGQFTHYTRKNGLSHEVVSDLSFDHQGALWIATRGGGLNRLQAGVFTTYTTRDGLSSDFVDLVRQDRDGSLWIGTRGGGLNLLKDGEFRRLPFGVDPSYDEVSSIFQDHEGSVWVHSISAGLSRWRNGQASSLKTANGLLGNEMVVSIHEDREGSLWLGMENGSVYQVKDGKFTTYAREEGLTADEVRTVCEGRDGSVWIGTAGGGLNRFKDGVMTAYTSKDGLASDEVFSVYEDHDAVLWIGTRAGLCRFQAGKFKVFTTRDGLSNDEIRSLCEGSDGGLWIGTRFGGINRFKDGHFSAYTAKEGLPTNEVRVLYESRDRSLWIGLNGGSLCRLQEGKLTIHRSPGALLNVRTIYEDRAGTLWIGSHGGGLSRFKNGKFDHYTREHGLLSDVLYQILEDDRDNLWISSILGIFMVSKKDLDEFAWRKTGEINCAVYGRADGMKSAECNGGSQPAGWKTRNGRLWFSTRRGVTVVDPNKAKTNPLPPPVVVEQVVIDRQPLGRGAGSELSPGKRQFEFHYAALSFLAPERVRYKYKLEGYDRVWVDADTRRAAFYTNIRPGHYTFRVKACNNDGIWNDNGASFAFYLAPHFYQTNSFYAVCALVVWLAGRGIYFLRVRQVQARAAELTLLVDERTKALQTEIGERKRAEQAARETEWKYRSIFENASEGIYQATPEGRYLSVNPALARILGYASPEEMMASVSDIPRQLYVDPARCERFQQLLAVHGKAKSFEYEACRKDGKRIWLSSNARVVRNAENQLLYFEGTVQEITERKHAEMELRRLSQRILDAQEQERQRVARELHDSVNQILASIRFRIHSIESKLINEDKKLLKDIGKAKELLRNALEEVRRISRNLRPSELDDLGLQAAVDSACAEFRQRTDITLELKCCSSLPERFSPELGLALYRIIQEALGNVEKHANATHVSLNLARTGSFVQLIIKDNGKGFVSAVAANEKGRAPGFGLVNMRERAALAKGFLTVKSAPNEGTEIIVLAPASPVQGGAPGGD